MLKRLTGVAFFTLNLAAAVQAESQDIMVLPLIDGPDGKYVSLEATHVTQREGYDNQPKFSPDGKSVYFTRMINKEEGQGQQADIFQYSLEDSSVVNVTQTNDISEYSATPYKKGYVSVIAVNPKGKQHLRLVNTETKEQEVLRSDIEPVGYYSWLSPTKAGVFVLGDVMTLQMLDTTTDEEPLVLARNIGRCFETVAPGVVTFTMEKDGVHHLHALIKDGSISSVDTSLPEGVQDYVWFDPTHVIVGKGSKLLLVNAAKTKELVDLKELDVSGITRLALSPDKKKIAIVYDRAE